MKYYIPTYEDGEIVNITLPSQIVSDDKINKSIYTWQDCISVNTQTLSEMLKLYDIGYRKIEDRK